MKLHLLRALAFLIAMGTCCAAPVQFTATLSAANEVATPPVNSPGTGTALVTYDPAAHTLQVNATFQNLVGATTASHIHAPAPAGMNAGVATQVPTFPGFPLGVMAGVYNSSVFDLTLASSWNPSFITNNGGTPASAEGVFASALFGGNAYFNIHTSVFGGGEIRGQLLAVGVPDGGSTVLLLATSLLALLGARSLLRGRT